MALQVKRGTTAERLSYTPLVGELIFDTSTKALYVGDGAASGGIAASALTFEDVQDYAAALLTGGSHTGISFSYNDTAGTISATVTAGGVGGGGPLQVAGDDSVIRVISDGETLQIVGGGGMFVSTNSEGKFTISPPGSYTSLSINNLSTSIIRSSDSSTINVTSPISFGTQVVADDDMYVAKRMTVGSYAVRSDDTQLDVIKTAVESGPNFVNFRQYHNEAVANALQMIRSRGTVALPLPIQNGDDLGSLSFSGYDGSNIIGVAAINVEVSGAVGTNSIPATMKFILHNGSARATRAELSGTTIGNMQFSVNNIGGFTRGWIGINSVPRLPVYADDAAAVTAIGAINVTNGMMYYDSTLHKFKGYANGAWVTLN